METKGKSTENWMNDLSESIGEHDVMQLRNKLKEIHVRNERELQSYSMNSAEGAGSRE
jgi:hypothetical protein